MPIKHAIWKVNEQPAPLPLTKLASEQQLEDMIIREPGILSGGWMLIGRREQTGLGGWVDLFLHPSLTSGIRFDFACPSARATGATVVTGGQE